MHLGEVIQRNPFCRFILKLNKRFYCASIWLQMNVPDIAGLASAHSINAYSLSDQACRLHVPRNPLATLVGFGRVQVCRRIHDPQLYKVLSTLEAAAQGLKPKKPSSR
jgi:hypothetical protein